MFEQASLDDREQEIMTAADEWWASRFEGRGQYLRMGPFKSAIEVSAAVMAFFRKEEHEYPPPAYVAGRPFAIYASSSKHGGSHVIVGNVYRDGLHRPTHKEVSQRVREEKELAAKARKPSRRRNTPRPTQV